MINRIISGLNIKPPNRFAWRVRQAIGTLHELPPFLSIPSIDGLLRMDPGERVLIGRKGTVDFLLCRQKGEPLGDTQRLVFSYARNEGSKPEVSKPSPYLAVQYGNISPGKQLINAYMAAHNVKPDYINEYVEELSQYLGAYPFVKVGVRYSETEHRGFLWSSMPNDCVKMLADMQKTQRNPNYSYFRSLLSEPFMNFILWCFDDGRANEVRFTPFDR